MSKVDHYDRSKPYYIWQERAPHGPLFVNTPSDGDIFFGQDEASAKQCVAALNRSSERSAIDRDRLIQTIWACDGPQYQGWPNIGERVYFGYRDQYPGALKRCERIADAVLAAVSSPTEGCK